MENQEIITKKCIKCQKVKPITDFYFRKDQNTYRNNCIKCHKFLHEQQKINNPKKYKESRKKSYFKNYDKNQITINRWILNHPQAVKEIKKRSYIKNSHRKLEHEKERLKTDIVFKRLHNLRRLIRSALKKQTKYGRSIDLLGHSIQEDNVYIQSQFYGGMTWETSGKLHGH